MHCGICHATIDQPVSVDPDFARQLRELTRADVDALPADDIQALSRFATVARHPADEVLFERGERADAMYIVQGGEVELVQPTASQKVVVQVVRRGTTVGDLSVMLEMPHAYTATTRKPTTLLRVDLDTIRTLVEISPDICYRFLRLVSRRLERTERRVVELLGASAFERVVGLLVDAAHEHGSATVDLRQADMAASESADVRAVRVSAVASDARPKQVAGAGSV